LFLLFALAAIPLFQHGCGGKSSPAAAPGAPIEIPAPAVLKFVNYDGLNIDVTSITTSVLEPNKLLLQTFDKANPTQNVLYFIELGPDYWTNFMNMFLKPVLTGIQKFDIPISKDTTTFSTTADLGGAFAGTRGVKIDFTRFDYNGNNKDDDCSGNTAELPICVRFWLSDDKLENYSRFIGGVFKSYPYYVSNPNIPDVIGEGDFKLLAGCFDGYQSTFAYNYGDKPTDNLKNIEYFFQTLADDQCQKPPCTGLFCDLFAFDEWDSHSKLSQQIGSQGSIFKSLNLVAQLYFPSASEFDLSYIGQYVEGGGLWSGTVLLQVDNASNGITNVCAKLPSGDVTFPDDCLTVGPDRFPVLIGETPFVRPWQPTDTAFPPLSVFPELPTF
jgi:hypothetical protein